jgi:hypothetical protein
MTKNKNNVYFLLLALALAFILMPVLIQSVSAAEQTKTLSIQLVDDETGRKVTGECTVIPNTGNSTFKQTNAGGQTTVTVDKDATSVDIGCNTAAGDGGELGVPLKENGVTRVTIVV